MLFLARMDVRSRAGMDAQTRAGVVVAARLASAAAEDFFGSAHG
jgi:muconolactone delta-isomerase